MSRAVPPLRLALGLLWGVGLGLQALPAAALPATSGEAQNTARVVAPQGQAEAARLWAQWWALAKAEAPSLKLASARQSQALAARLSAEPWLGSLPEFNLALGPRTAAGQWDADAIAGVQAPWPKPAWREARLAVAGALKAQVEAEGQAAVRRLRQQLRQGLAQSWGAARRVALAQSQLSLCEALAYISLRRRQAGLGDAVEEHLAWAEAANARQQVHAHQAALREAHQALAELVGQELALLPGLGLPPTEVPKLSLAAAQAKVLAQHPSLLAARAALAEAEAGQQVAAEGQQPAPTWGLQYAREGAAGSPASHIVLGSVGLPWPGGLSDPGALPRAEGLVRERQLALAQQRRAWLGRTELAWRQLQDFEPRLVAARKAEERAQMGLNLLRRAVAAGELGQASAGPLRRALVAAQSEAVGVLVAHQEALAEWEALLGPEGGSW